MIKWDLHALKRRDQYSPIIPCPVKLGASSSTFYLSDKEVVIDAPKSLVHCLLSICDGENTVEEVVAILSENWQSVLVRKFLQHLRKVGVIYDSPSISGYVWPFVKNPTRLVLELSDADILRMVRNGHKRHTQGGYGTPLPVRPSRLIRVIDRRCSTRVFSGKVVSPEVVARLLWAGYGVVQSPLMVDHDSPQNIKVWQKHPLARHTVPSAGALYPLHLSLCLLRPTGSCRAGIYHVRFRKPGSVALLLASRDTAGFLQSFADQTICNHAQGVIVVSGSFEVSSEKYGNRSLLYVPLEAGHVAQNIHLAAVENGIGTVEIGGFLEQPLQDTLQLAGDYWPLTTVLFGYAQPKSINGHAEIDNLEVRWANPIAGGYRLPFSMAFARFKSQKRRGWACGRAKSPEAALSKASSEAVEWAACGCIPRNLVRASFKRLDSAIDPREVVLYHKDQYMGKNFPLKPFSENQEYFWKVGRNEMTGENVRILSDCIFFPYTPEAPRFTYANSSGTAAHPDWNEAVRAATLELVERDAFMVVWLNRLTMPQVPTKSLPQGVQKRIQNLKKAGFRVVIKDFTLDLAPVLFVFAQNEDLPMTTCAGCSGFDVSSALDHALMEVEAAIYCRLNGREAESIRPRDVHYTDEHAALYEQRKFFHHADFLANGGVKVSLAEVGKNAPETWRDLLQRFELLKYSLITVNLSKTLVQVQARKLTIAKVFIPGIIPMNFGYGLEPCGMKRIYTVPVHLGHRSNPTPYRELTKFPHPYS